MSHKQTIALPSRRRLLAAVAGISASSVAGCLGIGNSDSNPDSSEFIVAATIRGDVADVERDYEPLVDWIESVTSVPTTVHPVQDPSAAITALATAQAHVAMLSGGPAWVGWQSFDLELLAAEEDAAGDTHYTAAAWVRSDSDIETLEDLAGVDSCHTGDLTGAGMLIPMASLAHEGLVSFDETDDVTAIRDAVDAFFGEPLIGGGYVGALQCLSGGHGDVAFTRASTPEDNCDGADVPDWCLPLDEYRLLAEFAEVPSHPIMASPEATEADIELLRDAFLSLNDDPDGQRILADVLGTHRLAQTTADEHLGDYGALIEILPGIEDHLVE